MEPTLQQQDVLAVVPMRPAGPRQGDIVAIDWRSWTGDTGPDAPMRVIGVAGDRVELLGGKVVLNGSVLPEPYVRDDEVTNPMPGQVSAWVVPDGAVFVLGDDRPAAADSRAYGFVPNRALIGRAVFRCGPTGRSGPIEGGRRWWRGQSGEPGRRPAARVTIAEVQGCGRDRSATLPIGGSRDWW
jgi:signal peptidase I